MQVGSSYQRYEESFGRHEAEGELRKLLHAMQLLERGRRLRHLGVCRLHNVHVWPRAWLQLLLWLRLRVLRASRCRPLPVEPRQGTQSIMQTVRFSLWCLLHCNVHNAKS